jgi:hypothetical protein
MHRLQQTLVAKCIVTYIMLINMYIMNWLQQTIMHWLQQTLVAKCIDEYIALRVAHADGAADAKVRSGPQGARTHSERCTLSSTPRKYPLGGSTLCKYPTQVPYASTLARAE